MIDARDHAARIVDFILANHDQPAARVHVTRKAIQWLAATAAENGRKPEAWRKEVERAALDAFGIS